MFVPSKPGDCEGFDEMTGPVRPAIAVFSRLCGVNGLLS